MLFPVFRSWPAARLDRVLDVLGPWSDVQISYIIICVIAYSSSFQTSPYGMGLIRFMHSCLSPLKCEEMFSTSGRRSNLNNGMLHPTLCSSNQVENLRQEIHGHCYRHQRCRRYKDALPFHVVCDQAWDDPADDAELKRCREQRGKKTEP